MKLRQRILLAIGGTTAALLGGIYVLSSSLLLNSYIELERRESEQNVDRVRDAMLGQAQDLHAASIDWSTWDDSFQFVQDGNKEFIKENLETLTLKLDTMIFLNSKGEVVYSTKMQRNKGVPVPDPESVRRTLGFDLKENVSNKRRTVGGLALIDSRICIVTARPIVPSANDKAPKGWIVWVLYVDQVEVKALSNRLHLSFEVFRKKDMRAPTDVATAVAKLRNPSNSISKPFVGDQVAGYGLIEDFSGASIAAVRVVEPRTIYMQGQESVQQIMTVTVLAGMIFSVVFIALIDAFALRRISKLTAQLDLAGEDSDSVQISLTGNDELSWLAKKTQEMVVRLKDKGEELRQNHDRLQETVSKLASANSVLEHAVEGIARMDPRGRIVATNVSFAQNLGFRRGELSERDWKTVVRQSDHERFQAALHEARTNGKAIVEIQAVKFNRSIFFAEIVIVRSDRPGVKSEGFHLFMKDISERKWLETRIEHQAFHDSLTGLPNRAKFMDRLGHAIQRSKRRESGLAVLFMDLDNFKIINDSLGHDAGDQLLIAIAQRLEGCLRDEDTIARLGGDEFTVLLEDLEGIDYALEVAGRIVETLSSPIHLDHGETVAMASIGIAYSMRGELSAESILRDADTAMYAAKDRGKSGYAVFDPSMNAEVVERMELEVGMRQALERQEFTLEYQPIVNLATGDITGIEALLRWDHPEKGRISPEKFIAVAEDSGLIVPIGAWVLRQACQQAKCLTERGLDLSVNISGRQLQRQDIVETVRTILDETGFDPTFLKLEVTESVLIRHEAESVEKLHHLKSLGIKIAIDDFGTGYSSLSTLNSYPVDIVKIDRTFISRMGQEEEVDAIVGAIVLLSRVMKLEVTAEGLETRQQVQYLQAFGCDHAQGYYFSRPLTWTALEELLAQGLNLSISLEEESQVIRNPILAA